MDQTQFFLYNTLCSVYIFEQHGGASEALHAAEHEAERIRKLLDYFDAQSELSVINRAAGKTPVSVSDELFTYISWLIRIAELSDGYVDPTVGPLVDLWDFTAPQPVCPSKDSVKDALQHTGWQQVVLDANKRSVFFERPGMRLDAGASGKGYAVDCVMRVLQQSGVTRAAVDFGGNIRVMETGQAGGNAWRVELQEPWQQRGKSIGSVLLKNEAIATSGGYDRYFQCDGKVYCHLLDPHTGYPSESPFLSTSVIATEAVTSDIMSTAFFVMGEDRAAAMLQVLDANAGYLLVETDGSVVISPQLQGRTMLGAAAKQPS